MEAQTYTLQEIAATAAASFEVATREDGSEYTRRKSDAPEWVQEMTFEAHGDMFPDDWRYACIAAACDAIAEADPQEIEDGDAGHAFSDSYVDVYTSNLFAWLSSNLTRQGYVDDAVSEFGGEPGTIANQIMLGQYAEALEVFESVLSFLQEKVA